MTSHPATNQLSKQQEIPPAVYRAYEAARRQWAMHETAYAAPHWSDFIDTYNAWRRAQARGSHLPLDDFLMVWRVWKLTPEEKAAAATDDAKFEALTLDLMRQYLDIIGCADPDRADIENAADVVMSASTYVAQRSLHDLDGLNNAFSSASSLILRAHALGWSHPRVRVVHKHFPAVSTAWH